jgi:hypothetical protein
MPQQRGIAESNAAEPDSYPKLAPIDCWTGVRDVFADAAAIFKASRPTSDRQRWPVTPHLFPNTGELA